MKSKLNNISPQLWPLVRQLAAELAQRPFEKSLLQQAAEYIKKRPDADFNQWLNRLARIGDLLASGRNTGLYRRELQAACQRLRPQPPPAAWPWILGWAARLYPYYKGNLAAARKISDVSRLPQPPEPPDIYRPPLQRRQSPGLRLDDLPEPPQSEEDVSDLARQFMQRLQEKNG